MTSSGLPSSPETRALGSSAAEVILVLVVATAIVAALQSAAPPVGLGSVYLLAVLVIAVRRGQRPAVATAVAGALILNFAFIAPRWTFDVAHTSDLVELVVSLIAALLVGRLAATERLRAREAQDRAHLAAAREEEATLVAEVASAILSRRGLEAQVASVERLLARRTRASGARLITAPDRPVAHGEQAIRLRAAPEAWLVLDEGSTWEPDQLQRIAEPLGRLLDVARERERTAEQVAEVEAARRAEAARTAVLHAISHDLRSPLTAIGTAAYALRSGRATETEHDELVETIELEGRRLTKLVDDLLDVSMIEAGAVRPRADWCDLHDVVSSAAAGLRASDQISFELPDDLPLVRADLAQLERVFSNLLENAIKFSPPGSPVRVRGASVGGRVTVRIIDQGRGIPRSERAHVFDPFFRGRGETGPGSGLGLSICRGFVEANGGDIVVQSGEREGTSFAVSLPAVRQPEAGEDSVFVPASPALRARPGDEHRGDQQPRESRDPS